MLLTVLSPVWLLAGVVIGAIRRRSFVTLRLLLFAWLFFGVAIVALPGPTILLMRYASILDTLLTSVYLQGPTQWRVRYILKQELLFDPCLDIVGNALPNYSEVDCAIFAHRGLEGLDTFLKDTETR
ncbi:MAG: hypothetical protein WBB42_09060 [Polyangiales bacterium]